MEVIATGRVLFLAALLFAVGLAALLARRNAVFMLIAVEVMFNAAGLAFVAAGASHGQTDGMTMFVFILAMAAAEAAVALALVLQLKKRFGTVDVDTLSTLSG